MKKVCIVFFTLLLLLTTSCKTNMNTAKKGNTIKVTTTTTMIQDLVENIGGEFVTVTGLMGPGVDPHLYKASQGDIDKLQKADIIFYNGLHLEGKMTGVFEKMSRKKPVIPVAKKVSPTVLLKTDDNQYDPHIWFDVTLWMKAADQVKDSLIGIDPSHKKEFEQQTLAYKKKLETLHTYVQKNIQSIPKNKRVLVTAHDAFGYFGKAYSMEVVGLQGISTISEYGLKDVRRIRDLLVNRKIKAVFIESSVPKRSINAVVNGAKEKRHHVNIGGELYSDAMGPKDTKQGSYIGMVEHNVNTIVDALK